MCGGMLSGRGWNRASPFVVVPRVVSAFLLYVHYMITIVRKEISFADILVNANRVERHPSINPFRLISPMVGAEISVRMASTTTSSSSTPIALRYRIEPSTPIVSGSSPVSCYALVSVAGY